MVWSWSPVTVVTQNRLLTTASSVASTVARHRWLTSVWDVAPAISGSMLELAAENTVATYQSLALHNTGTARCRRRLVWLALLERPLVL